MEAFRGRTGVNMVLNNNEFEVDSCYIEAEPVTHDFILPPLLHARKEFDAIEMKSSNSDTIPSSVPCNLPALTNLSGLMAVIEYCKSGSSHEREFICTQIQEINARNLFTRYSKADSDMLRHLYQRLEGIDQPNIASQIYANEKSFCPVNEEYRAKYIQGYVKNADVHYHSINFNPGDQVLISKSFDTNVKTKKMKLDGFYEEGLWTIMERIGSDSFKVKSNSNETSRNRL